MKRSWGVDIGCPQTCSNPLAVASQCWDYKCVSLHPASVYAFATVYLVVILLFNLVQAISILRGTIQI